MIKLCNVLFMPLLFDCAFDMVLYQQIWMARLARGLDTTSSSGPISPVHISMLTTTHRIIVN